MEAIRFNGKCGSCGSLVSVLAPLVRTIADTRYFVSGPLQAIKVGKGFPQGKGVVVCSCETKVRVATVQGTITRHQCDDKCAHAEDLVCKCSCGGLNHGSLGLKK